MLAFWLARREQLSHAVREALPKRHRHVRPHFECVATRHEDRCAEDDPELNKPAIGHVCRCSRRCCSVIATGPFGERVEICICRGCDVHACGLHSAALPMSG